MHRYLFVIAILSLFLSAAQISSAELAPSCGDEVWQGATYTICRFDPAKETIRIYNKRTDGTPYGNFDSLIQGLWQEHHILTVAMNGGMYEDDLSPAGLFMEYGQIRHPANLRDGWGNFHLKPNGVFYVAADKAGVMETSAFLAQVGRADFATQSGPMLVIDGKIHPRFLPDSDSLKIRNGVGVDVNGQVFFAISQGPVRFFDFATLFRDRLKTPNALFLDGSISSLAIPEQGRIDRGFPLGVIIAVIGTRP
ncbi:phosphodiester glycosidase family protein [Rhizobium paknamense]|uniref:Uncharacterized protein YigE (DUF2233 family) n=1 Tax=Rhizobium paknamense TaxID=1206817 RepID=A0ABU0I878_9HYPH|nr:phosphodiester glycosidase family protein [Rhizobium paknamense]MDQ0453803.1 uncharacterized protein YigE (DUF2233 family) [Rhizobium paknamense]